jgi:hypothetical protein
MSSDEIRPYLLLVAACGIVALLWLLSVILCREWIKADLVKHGLTPLHIRWRPWLCATNRCRFEVHYLDADGGLHRSVAVTGWHGRKVRWEGDEIIDDQLCDQL